MAESAEPSQLAKRLRQLPGQLLLALVNATALLVIVAAVLTIIALNRVNHAAAALAGNVTQAVVAEIDLEPEGLVRGIRELGSEIRDLRTAIAEGRAEWPGEIERKIEGLTQAVARLDATLTEASGRVIDRAIRQVGDSVTDGLLRLRNCGEGEIVPPAAIDTRSIGPLDVLSAG